MFEETFRQKIKHHIRIGMPNARGDSTYKVTDIKARVEPSVRTLLNQKGEEFTSSSLVMTKANVKPGDMLEWDGVKRVVQITSRADSLFGEHTHYECYV